MNKNHRAPWLSGMLLLCASWGALAEPADGIPADLTDLAADTKVDPTLFYSEEDVVSIATGYEQRISHAPSVASVLKADDIRKLGARTLSDVLEAIPGLHVGLSSDRFTPSYSIRGISTFFNPHVLVLMNGVPITQLFGGDRGDMFELPVANISRVEVIRGPGSALYGADAFAGTINVVTKSASEINGTEAGARVGSFDSADIWVLHGAKLGDWNLAFGIEAQHTNGDPDRIIAYDTQSFFDEPFVLGTNASLAPGPAETRRELINTHLELTRGDWAIRLWNWRLQDAGVGPGVAAALDPTGSVDEDNYLFDIYYQNPSFVGKWGLEARVNYFQTHDATQQVLFPPGTVLPIGADGNINFAAPVGLVTFTDGYIGNPGVDEQRLALDLAMTYTGITNHRLRFAAGGSSGELEANSTQNFGTGVIDGTVPVIDGTLTEVTGTPFIFIPDKSRVVKYVSLQDEWNVAPDWVFTGGLRYDHYSDFGSTVNPRLALIWNARYNLTAKLLYGRAFRAPAFFELYGINNPVALGNPSLQPETIDTLELAFDWQPTLDTHTRLNIFSYDIDDLIEFVPDATGTTATAQNAGGQRGHGLELEASWKVRRNVTLWGNFAWQQPENKQTDTRVADVPGHQIYLGLDWDFAPQWSLNGQINHVADRQRIPADPRPDLNDYTTVDLTLQRNEALRGLDLALSIRNLFDEDVREPSPGDPAYPQGSAIPGDYPGEGRSLYAELRYQF